MDRSSRWLGSASWPSARRFRFESRSDGWRLQVDAGAITLGDEELELTSRRVVTRERISSTSRDAGHAKRFALLLEDFAEAIAEDGYVGDEAVDAARCVELIEASASARKGGREVLLGARRANGQLLTTGAG